ncbi:MAG: indole-3-glycerol phosphate synthase TrpC [Pseudomonadota bacterium]
MNDILAEIIAHKRHEVAHLKKRHKLEHLGIRGTPLRGGGPFWSALAGKKERIRLIAEVKKASPSAGLIRPDFDPVALARSYHQAGARAISVITDEKFFQGHIDYLAAVSRAVPLPVLRKDFLIDPYQIYEARLKGAGAVLLIASVLPLEELKELRSLAANLGMDSLVEVHNEADLAVALAAGANIIGVNNRDLRDFSVSLETTLRLRPRVPAGVVLVSESGIKTREDVLRLQEAGVDAILVGESLMRSADVGAKARELLGK